MSGPRSSPRYAASSSDLPTPTRSSIVDIVLGPAEDYPVGSVTRFDRADLPLDGVVAHYEGEFTFYRVRGPNGFYATTTDFLGNGTKCDLRVLRQPPTYVCPEWRWDRFGNVLEAGAPWPDGTSDLLILPTPRSWDGQPDA
jgi:hypothetical protein